MLDWKEPLPLHRIVERGLALFEAVLPRTIALAVGGGVATNLLAHSVLGEHYAEIDALIQRAALVELFERFGPTFALLALPLLWLSVAVLHLVGNAGRGGVADAVTSAGVALRALPHVLIGTLLYFVALWGGLLLLLVPGIWLTIALSMYLQAIVFDGNDGLRALGASFRLTRGNWWRTLGIFMVVMVGMLLGILVSGLVTSLITGVLGFALEPLVVGYAEVAIGAALGAVIGIAVDAVLVAYYYDLTLRAGNRSHDGSLAV